MVGRVNKRAARARGRGAGRQAKRFPPTTTSVRMVHVVATHFQWRGQQRKQGRCGNRSDHPRRKQASVAVLSAAQRTHAADDDKHTPANTQPAAGLLDRKTLDNSTREKSSRAERNARSVNKSTSGASWLVPHYALVSRQPARCLVVCTLCAAHHQRKRRRSCLFHQKQSMAKAAAATATKYKQQQGLPYKVQHRVHADMRG